MSRVLTSGKAVTPERRAAARQRAVEQNIQVFQVADSGFWIATSGRKGSIAYPLTINDGQVVHCGCQAALYGGYCKHRAAWEMARESEA